MKLILSRKGIDSSFGNCASPILPDGTLCWLPIPENTASKPNLPTYGDVNVNGDSMGKIVSDLSSGKIPATQQVHLDPDLNPTHLRRLPGWQPTFGQTGAAQRHLQNNRVGPGDLFLFFGWFRQAEYHDGRLRFVRNAPDVHVVNGWLQIDRWSYNDIFFEAPDWMASHPHIQGEPYDKLDSIYTATNKLVNLDLEGSVGGAGVFTHLHEALVLTAPGCSRSNWRLPAVFFPRDRPPLSYHSDMSRWTLRDESAYLRAASRGQEFVLDLDHYPEVARWLESEIFGQSLASVRQSTTQVRA